MSEMIFNRVCRHLLGCVLAAGLASASLADAIHVPSEQAPTIQAGIDLAENGDTVLVGPGRYNEAIDFLGKTIIVESSAGAEATIIDAAGLEHSVVTVASGEGVGTELRGFTITGGIGTLFGSTMLGGDGSDDNRDAGGSVELMVQTIDGTAEAVGGAAAGGGGYRVGGGVRVFGSAILIEDCIITGNHVPTNGGSGGGGGFLVSQPQGVEVRDCVIEDNTAWLGGGGIVSQGSIQLFDSTFRSNAADQGGGFNVNNNAHAIISGCVFETNAGGHLHETAVFGGGAMVLSNATASFIESQFIHNTSTRNGGGLSVFGPGTTVNQCVFEQNTAVRGGGISSSGTLNVLSSQFIGNQAIGDELRVGGGGLYVDDFVSSPNTTLSDSTFIGNSVSGADQFDVDGGGGGALLARTVTMTNCIFEGNTSNTYGGGVSVVISTAAVPNITGCTFENNYAPYGGGMMAVTKGSLTDAKINVTDCQFEGNSTIHGGGLMRSGRDGGSVITGCTFVNNTAEEFGGAMRLAVRTHELAQRMQVVDCTFAGNSADVSSGVGGGIALTAAGGTEPARVDFIKCVFQNNSAWLGGGAIVSQTGHPFVPWPPSRFMQCTFDGNSALDGGAININNSGSAIITDCEFNVNIATGHGGAVLALQTAFAEMHSSVFIGNQANFGGAMSVHGSESANIHDCTFEANTALMHGGAIHGSQAYIASHCQFIGNSAGERGGAISAEGIPHIHGGTFTGNTAGDEGGAIFSWEGDGAKLQGVLVCANSPDNIGGPFQDLGNNLIDDKCHIGVVIHVPQDYATIQEAIDAAISGDEIIAAPGLYAETIDYSGKRLVVRSSDGPAVTIIDPTGGMGTGFGTGRVVTVASDEGAGTTLRGFTITGGDGSQGGGVWILNSMLLIDDCIITENGSGSGAGIYMLGNARFAEVTVINSRISNNIASGNTLGGGVRAIGGRLHLIDTVIEGNSAGYGGALAVSINGIATCSGCEIRDNSATHGGGGVGLLQDAQFFAADSLFCGNAPDGPVVHVPSGAPWTEGDLGGNVFLDDCPAQPVPGDLNGDGVVDVSDLLILLGAWGTCADPNNCPADFNDDGAVDVGDLLILLGNWG